MKEFDRVLQTGFSHGTILKVSSCLLLVFFSVAATLCAEASKTQDGTFPYSSVLIPASVEALKLLISGVIIIGLKLFRVPTHAVFKPRTFVLYSVPAFCYFISNNCMFYIIKFLGPTNFQILNNLKIIATGILMRLFLGRQLSWMRWKALLLLVFGSVVSQLNCSEAGGSITGYVYVFINSFAAGAGGVISEKLLKGDPNQPNESIHWVNIQLYFFGMLFGISSLVYGEKDSETGFLSGLNFWAYATILSLTVCGLLVSFILKHLDNFAKCFVTACAILIVATMHASSNGVRIPLNLLIGILITVFAIEQYTVVQA